MPLENRRRAFGGLIFGLLITFILLNFFQMYYIGGTGTADFLWNENEGYLFVHGGRQGYRISYLGYLTEMIKEPLGIVPSADDRKLFTLVFHITPTGVEQYETTSTFEFFTPIDHTVYAACEGSLWKWTGSRFEAATANENVKVHGIEGLTRNEFNQINGWSGRYSITSERFSRITANIGAKPVTISVKTLNAANNEVSIDLLSPDRPDETVYHMSFRPKRVAKTEYEKTFPES